MIKGANSLLRSIGAIKRAHDLLTSCINDIPGKGPIKRAAITARNRLEAAYTDIVTAPAVGDNYRTVIRAEWGSDQWTIEAIEEKLARLHPQTRETIETLLDALIAGKKIQILTDEDLHSDT